MTEENKGPEEPKYLVAILAGDTREVYDGYDYSNEFVAYNMTDWEEVTKEEYDALLWASKRTRTFQVLRRLGIDDVLPKSVEDYKTWVKKQADELQRAKQKIEAEKAKRKATADAKKAAKLAKLAEELGVRIEPNGSATVGSTKGTNSTGPG